MSTMRRGFAVGLVVVAAACTARAADDGTIAIDSTSSTTTTVAPTTTTTLPPTTTTTLPPTTTTLPPPVRVVTESGWAPFATVGGVTLVHPSAHVERVGFHESNNDGARQLEILPTAVNPIVLETRERGTGSQTAADMVVDPAVEIRAPVTGTVKRSGGYILYCEHEDDFVVIEPDDHPGWEVKILHINGEQVSNGDYVIAGETVLAAGPTQLPFESQVDEVRTVDPAWPHVHIEVVDPTIPDRPTPGGCG